MVKGLEADPDACHVGDDYSRHSWRDITAHIRGRPTLKLAINADEDSYLSGVEQRYVVEFSCASTTEGCLNSVVTITLPHTITPAGNSNPDSAPDGVNATATAGNKVVTLEIKRPTWSGYQTKGGTTIQMRDKVGISMSLGTHKNEAYISATEP
ncbi:hypothetical protein [uncultured Actinomyces sp.]|uniref:hypothetical protein n=1 Tax=uncultured Actinomyces sp. TaxID=249061 RepID=UPI00325FC190